MPPILDLLQSTGTIPGTLISRDHSSESRLPSPIPRDLHNGLIGIVVIACLSATCTASLFTFLTYRMIQFPRFIGCNQCVVLIYNLVLADLLQSVAFLLSAKSVAYDSVSSSSPSCFAQGLLLQIGDPGSGLFVFVISLHTFFLVSLWRRIGHRTFVCFVLGAWCFITLLVILPPILYERGAFVPSGAWVCDKYQITVPTSIECPLTLTAYFSAG